VTDLNDINEVYLKQQTVPTGNAARGPGSAPVSASTTPMANGKADNISQATANVDKVPDMQDKTANDNRMSVMVASEAGDNESSYDAYSIMSADDEEHDTRRYSSSTAGKPSAMDSTPPTITTPTDHANPKSKLSTSANNRGSIIQSGNVDELLELPPPSPVPSSGMKRGGTAENNVASPRLKDRSPLGASPEMSAAVSTGSSDQADKASEMEYVKASELTVNTKKSARLEALAPVKTTPGALAISQALSPVAAQSPIDRYVRRLSPYEEEQTATMGFLSLYRPDTHTWKRYSYKIQSTKMLLFSQILEHKRQPLHILTMSNVQRMYPAHHEICVMNSIRVEFTPDSPEHKRYGGQPMYLYVESRDQVSELMNQILNVCLVL
jgi:hypothetical protein